MAAKTNLSLRPHRPSLVEAIEPRCHFTVTTWTSDTISPPENDFYGQVRIGSNGILNGEATAISGMGESIETDAFPIWDTNLLNGLDSGWKSVTFALNTKNTGSVSFKVGTSGVETFYGGTEIAVNSVTIRAGVQTLLTQMDWRNLVVTFYSGTQIVETDTLSNFSASTMSGGLVQEQGIVLTPTATNCTGVSVTGQVRLQGLGTALPYPMDLFGDIQIN